jgi:2-oxoglutarate dehydrogenase complex, dehydrogenase (E1) component, and related enzymes
MSSSKNIEISKTSFLSKSNSAFIEDMYIRFLEKDPSLPESWRSYFLSLGENIDE